MINSDSSISSVSDSSDDEPTAKLEVDPLLMRPQPPKNRIPAVLAIKPERLPHKFSYKYQKGRPIVQHLNSAMVKSELNKLLRNETGGKTHNKNNILSNLEVEAISKPKESTQQFESKVSDAANKSTISPAFRDNINLVEMDNTIPEPIIPSVDPDWISDYLSGDVSVGNESDCEEDTKNLKKKKENRKKRKKKKKLKEKQKQLKPTSSFEQMCNRPNCIFVSSSRAELNMHKREVHRNKRDFACDQCSYRSASAADLRKHYRIHSSDMPYHCPEIGCTFKGRHSNSLDYHQKKVHPSGEPLKCEIAGCGFSTYMSMTLKNHHIKNHGNGKTVACDLCAYRCYLPADLRKHLRAHSGDTPYACDWPGCGYACKISSNLRKHKRIHTEERPYACDMCAFRSNFISSLKAHKRIHTNERPYCCEQCGYRCNSTSNLKKHIVQRHPGTVYSGPGGTGAAIRAAKFAIESANAANNTNAEKIISASRQPKHKKDTPKQGDGALVRAADYPAKDRCLFNCKDDNQYHKKIYEINVYLEK